MIQEFKDEILDTSGQLDNKTRYRIRNNIGEVLQDDVQIEVKTPVTQEGTSINSELLKNILNSAMEIKTLSLAEKEDNSYFTTMDTKVFAQAYNNTISSEIFSCAKTYGQEDIKVKFSTASGKPIKINSTNSTDYIQALPYNSNADYTATYSKFNTYFSQTMHEYDKWYHSNRFSTYRTYSDTMHITWDLIFARTISFKYSVTYDGVTGKLYGSNDNTNWVELGTLVGGMTNQTINSTEEYRYYRASFTFGADKNMFIHYMYIVLPNYYTYSYKNKFTVQQNLNAQKYLLCQVPSEGVDTVNVSSNSINGIDVIPLLQVGRIYQLVKQNNSISLVSSDNTIFSRIIEGIYTDSTASAITANIILGAKPKYVICWHSDNNYTSIASQSAGSTHYSHVPRIVSELSLDDRLTDNGFTINLSGTGSGNTYHTLYYLAII